jgi:hypothetical protein
MGRLSYTTSWTPRRRRRGLGDTVPTPVRSARGIRELEVLDPNHEDDIVPVILEEPDHHGALAVTYSHVQSLMQ